MGLLSRLFASQAVSHPVPPLYDAIVAIARDRRWYKEGGVPDTLDGRFDMLALALSLVLLRLDREGEALRATAVQLTERFIDDMDAQIREIGIGDFVVGKHVGKMMGALGGRLDAYGDTLAEGGDLNAALVRNLYRGSTPADAALAFAAGETRRLHHDIEQQPLDRMLLGELPG